MTTPTNDLIAGVDEAGRGTLAGPVVAAAAIVPSDCLLTGVTDSKKLSEPAREEARGHIRASVDAWSIGWATAAEVDRLNVLEATMLAMRRAVDNLPVVPGRVLVDGDRIPDLGPSLALHTQSVIGGDALEPAISAASILAKVARDRWMLREHERFPAYGFDRHKGYGTAAHLAALEEHGACAIHRMSFRPVRACEGSDAA